jgi:hypothetical protein
MATRPPIGASTFALELDGAQLGVVASVALPALTLSDTGQPGFGDFAARFNVTGGSKMLDWLVAVMRGQVTNPAGAVLLANHNFDIQRRVDWSAGQLTGLAFDTLDARDAKKPFAVNFGWRSAGVKFSKGAGKLSTPVGGKAKGWLTSNFRVSGLPFVAAQLQAIEWPTVTLTDAAKPVVALGSLRLTLAGPAVVTALEWALKMQSSGPASAADRFTLRVDMLDASLAKTLGTIVLEQCAWLSFEEARFETASEAVHSATLVLSVGSMDFLVTP